VSDFDALMSAIRWHPHKLIFYAFDLLHLDGKDLRERPLIERMAKLKALLGTNETSLDRTDEVEETAPPPPAVP
jgi:bifunctional non-homologous end joining protein LigD